MPPRRINEIVKGTRSITVDTALRLERYFRWPAEVWLNLQAHHDQHVARDLIRAELDDIRPLPCLVERACCQKRVKTRMEPRSPEASPTLPPESFGTIRGHPDR